MWALLFISGEFAYAAEPASAQTAASAKSEAADAERRDLRARIRDGKFNTCIVEDLSNEGANYTLRLQNKCDLQVNVRLCLRIGPEPKAYYMLIFDAQTESRTRFWTKQGENFRYNYNSCNKPNCNPPASEC